VLPLPYAVLRSVNAYLLELNGGLCLVDCGSALPPGWDAVVHALAMTGHEPADIQRLICTHLHQDHAGLAATVAHNTGCELGRPAGPDAGHDMFRDRMIPLGARRRRALAEGVPAARLELLVGPLIAGDGDYQRPTFDRMLEAGETLPGPHGTWEVVSVPGHAAAQLALFDPARKWMISADLLSEGPVPMLQFGGLPDPLGAHLASLDRALALAPARLLPGHGRPIEPEPAVRLALRASQSAALGLRELALRSLRTRSLTGFEFSELLDPDNPGLEWRQTAMSSAMCALEHLAVRGQARSWVGADRVRRFTALQGVPRRELGSRDDG
jgi:glyoxylase-like metal-dependent hydrolase (beta-lactamase superfamily II)